MPEGAVDLETSSTQKSPSLSQSCTKIEKYDLLKTLAEGKFKVELVTDPVANKKYACKIFDCKSPMASTLYIKEKEVASLMTSNNTIKLIQCLEDQTYTNKTGEKITFNAVVSEYADHGDLFQYVECGHFDENSARCAFNQIVEGLGHLHAKGWAHLDLKLENIFVSEGFILKIGDYDLCGIIDEKIVDGMIGTVSIRSPEMFEDGRFRPIKADIFALGVVLFSICFGYPPFIKATSYDPFYRHIRSKTYEAFWQMHENIAKVKKLNLSISKELKELLNKLLAYEDVERPSIEEIKQSVWLKNEKYDNEGFLEEMGKRLKKIS